MANTKVTTGVIKDDAVGADQLASNSVVTASIVDNAITTAKINNDAILTAKISNSAVTNAKLAANSVDSDQYVDGSIDTAHIADGQITSAKLDTNISVSGELTVGSHLNMGDNDILKIGASDDLQIYHDGSNSYITDTGTGNLLIRASNELALTSAGGDAYFLGINGGASYLYYAGAVKLQTTSSGIDVTGTAVTDGLTSSGNINLDLATPTVIFKESGAAKFFIGESSAVGGGSGFYDMYAVAGLGQRFFTGAAERMRIHDSNCVGIGSTVDRSIGTNIGTLVVNGSVGGGLWLSGSDSSATTSKIYSFVNGTVGRLILNQGTGVGGGDIHFTFNESATPTMTLNSNGTMGFGMSALGSNNGSAFFDGNVSSKDGFMTTASDLTLLQPSAGNSIFVRDNGNESMRINSSGGLLIGKTTAGSTNTGCEFGGSGTGGLAFNLTSTNECFTYNNNNSSGATYLIDFRQNNASKGQIQVSSTSTTYATSSDYRLKENIQPLENGLQRLNELNPVQFDWKEDGTSSEGFIAHEVQEIFPDAVSHEKDGEQMQSMDYGRITPLLVKAIQEQQAQIETLKQEIQELKE
jgi:hypothetical protein